MKKITISILIIVSMLLLSIANISYAANLQADIEITPDKQEAVAGEMVTFNLKIKNIVNAQGDTVSAAGGTITYNNNFFETINPDDCSVVVNAENGEFNTAFTASKEKDIGYLKLKVKENPTGSGTVTFTNLVASDGEQAASTSDISFTINIKTPEPDEPVDVTAPVINGVTNGGQYEDSVTITATDEGTGIDESKVELKKDGTVVSNFKLGDTVTEEGEYELTVQDKSGNIARVQFTINKKQNDDENKTPSDGNTTDDDNNAGENTVDGNKTGENTVSPDNTIKPTDDSNKNNLNVSANNKDTTTANKIIPYTGKGKIILLIVVVAIIGGIMYKRYKFYNSIK